MQDPSSSIPKGTLLSILISMFSYCLFVLFAGGAALRDASGNVTDIVDGSLIGDLDCLHDHVNLIYLINFDCFFFTVFIQCYNRAVNMVCIILML